MRVAEFVRFSDVSLFNPLSPPSSEAHYNVGEWLWVVNVLLVQGGVVELKCPSSSSLRR
jgi:hypothetical protein